MSRRYKHFTKKIYRKCKSELSFNNKFHVYLKKCTTKKRDVIIIVIKKNVVVALKIQTMNAIKFVNEMMIFFSLRVIKSSISS